MTNLWDQQPKESSKAFLAFTAYRDLGLKRSCQKVAESLGKSLSAILELSKKHNWQERVKAFDAHLDKQAQQNQLELVKAMKTRQIKIALKAQKAALKGIETLLKSNQIQAKPDALSKLLDVGCRIERLNRDEPEQNVEVLNDQNFQNLSLEELETLRNLMLKAKA